jgi:hypothetical protein
MFDFPKWRVWLEQKSHQLREQGLEVRFEVGPDDGPKPGMTMGFIGLNAMAGFENWNTGETDYTIMAPASREAKIVSHRWGIIVDDETFEMTLDEFIDEFRKFEILS